MADLTWRPIETAPKDGTLILLWDAPDASCRIGQWQEKKMRWWCSGLGYPAGDPFTHWMPLPPPPQARGERVEKSFASLSRQEVHDLMAPAPTTDAAMQEREDAGLPMVEIDRAAEALCKDLGLPQEAVPSVAQHFVGWTPPSVVSEAPEIEWIDMTHDELDDYDRLIQFVRQTLNCGTVVPVAEPTLAGRKWLEEHRECTCDGVMGPNWNPDAKCPAHDAPCPKCYGNGFYYVTQNENEPGEKIICERCTTAPRGHPSPSVVSECSPSLGTDPWCKTHDRLLRECNVVSEGDCETCNNSGFVTIEALPGKQIKCPTCFPPQPSVGDTKELCVGELVERLEARTEYGNGTEHKLYAAAATTLRQQAETIAQAGKVVLKVHAERGAAWKKLDEAQAEIDGLKAAQELLSNRAHAQLSEAQAEIERLSSFVAEMTAALKDARALVKRYREALERLAGDDGFIDYPLAAQIARQALTDGEKE